MVAMAVLSLLQVPPPAGSLRVIAEPIQRVVLPEIGAGAPFTVITAEAGQAPNEYNIVAVPIPAPDTIPLLFIVATNVLLLAQVPPVAASANGIVVPMHRLAAPVTGSGSGFTVTTALTEQPAGGE
jgi:hypothetical protein